MGNSNSAALGQEKPLKSKSRIDRKVRLDAYPPPLRRARSLDGDSDEIEDIGDISEKPFASTRNLQAQDVHIERSKTTPRKFFLVGKKEGAAAGLVLEDVASSASPRMAGDERLKTFSFKDELRTKYNIQGEISRGESGVVRACTFRGSSAQKLACKTIGKKNIQPRDLEDVQAEVQILRTLPPHPNIVQLKEVVEDGKAYHIVMELCEGKDLASLFSQSGFRLREEYAALVFLQVARAVKHLHDNSIFHGDIKLENILLKCSLKESEIGAIAASPGLSIPSLSSGTIQLIDEYKLTVKLSDFGFARRLSPGQKLRNPRGTVCYFAPEVFASPEGYGLEADVWALGVLLFVLLTGKMPFQGYTDIETLQLIKKGRLVFERFSSGSTLSEGAQELIRKILIRSPASRPSLHEIICDDWLDHASVGLPL